MRRAAWSMLQLGALISGKHVAIQLFLFLVFLGKNGRRSWQTTTALGHLRCYQTCPVPVFLGTRDGHELLVVFRASVSYHKPCFFFTAQPGSHFEATVLYGVGPTALWCSVWIQRDPWSDCGGYMLIPALCLLSPRQGGLES